MKVRKNQERGLERVSHLFLSGSEPAMEKERVTIQAAARTLGVSKGTIITYLNKGLLTRIKKDGRIYIEMDEVRSLREGARGAAGSMPRDQSKQPLNHFGQFEKEGQGQPEAALEAKHKELERLKSELDNLRQNLQTQTSELAETKTKLRQLEKEQKKGLLNFDKATEVNDHKRQDTQARLYAVEQELKRLKQPSWKESVGNPPLRSDRFEKKKMVLFTILSLLGVLLVSVWWSNRSPTQPPTSATEGQVYGSGTVQANSQLNSPSVEAPASAEKRVSPWLEEDQQVAGLASTTAVYVLRAETLARTWLHLIIDDSQELEYLLEPDEQYTWRARTGFRLHIGNAAGLMLYLNDQPLKALGESGEVVLLHLPDPSLMASSNSEYTVHESGSQ
jgi:DNA-binding transcriptional MerR regulator